MLSTKVLGQPFDNVVITNQSVRENSDYEQVTEAPETKTMVVTTKGDRTAIDHQGDKTSNIRRQDTRCIVKMIKQYDSIETGNHVKTQLRKRRNILAPKPCILYRRHGCPKHYIFDKGLCIPKGNMAL
jgi:hypothetical protein